MRVSVPLRARRGARGLQLGAGPREGGGLRLVAMWQPALRLARAETGRARGRPCPTCPRGCSRPPAAMMAPPARGEGSGPWPLRLLTALQPPPPPRRRHPSAASRAPPHRRHRYLSMAACPRPPRPSPPPCAALRGAGVTRRAACEAVPADTGWHRARCGTSEPRDRVLALPFKGCADFGSGL